MLYYRSLKRINFHQYDHLYRANNIMLINTQTNRFGTSTVNDMTYDHKNDYYDILSVKESDD